MVSTALSDANDGTSLPPLIRALLSPTRYACSVGHVDLIETHISWVLLAGEFAYKIKKPVKLAFLDFSTLARRKRFCEEELRLNGRFSPDIYLNVVGIFESETNPRWEGNGAPIEYAVRMRRFDQSARLDHVCRREELTPAHLSDLARRVTVFHQAANVAPADSRYGSNVCVIQQVRDNFDELLNLTNDRSKHQRLRTLSAWTEMQHTELTNLINARKQSGFVRECHGDLHLANLVLLEQKVHLFDCIEFNADLRWIDVASELAFTYIDLLVLEQTGLATWFVNEALSASGDYQAAPLLRFYAVYRALVRFKVTLIQAKQTGVCPSEALRYLALAERLSVPPPPMLLITHGVSGCGKTWTTDLLLQHDQGAATLRLRTDVERKRIWRHMVERHIGSSLNAGLYDVDANERTYAYIREIASLLLHARWSVIVDGTFLHRTQRDQFHALAREYGVLFGILAPLATADQLRMRIVMRNVQGQDASDATLEILKQQLIVCEPLATDEPLWSGMKSK